MTIGKEKVIVIYMNKLLLKNLKTGEVFEKEFETEFEKDKFIRKLRYSKNIMLMKDYKKMWDD